MKNKRKYFVMALFLLLFLLLFSIFSGIFSNPTQKITAEVVSNLQIKEGSIFESTCYDSDGTNYYQKGYREFKGKFQEEYCLKVETTGKMYVKEYYCHGEFVQECPGDCIEGACVSEEKNKELMFNFVEDVKGFFKKVL